MNSLYFKIEHSADGSNWRRSLFQGKPSEFITRDEARLALGNKNSYPDSLRYRIVRVMEEVVCEQSQESSAVA